MIFTRAIPALVLLGVVHATDDSLRGSDRDLNHIVCTNTAAPKDNDSGCPYWYNLCVLNNNQEPSPGQQGDKCIRAFCVNDDPDDDDTDWGCNWYNRCVDDNDVNPGPGKVGTKCIRDEGGSTGSGAVCKNTNGPKLNDEGCPNYDNLCVDNNNVEPASGQDGDKCIHAFCVDDDLDDTKIDWDCNWYNRCVDDNDANPGLGKVGTKCIRDEGGNGAVCTDDASSALTPDTGCSGWDYMCLMSDGSQPGNNQEGDKCGRPVCVDTKWRVIHIEGQADDFGCYSSEYRCVDDNGDDPRYTSGNRNIGTKCARPACVNTEASDSSSKPDFGCYSYAHKCVDANGTTEPTFGKGTDSIGAQCI